MIPIVKALSLVPERLPNRALLDPSAAGACLSRLGSPKMTANFATSHEVRIGRQQTLEESRPAATVSSDIDKSGQSGLR